MENESSEIENAPSKSLSVPGSATLPTLRKNTAYSIYAYDFSGAKVLFYYPFINTVRRRLPFKMSFTKPGDKNIRNFNYKGKSDRGGLTFDYLEV